MWCWGFWLGCYRGSVEVQLQVYIFWLAGFMLDPRGEEEHSLFLMRLFPLFTNTSAVTFFTPRGSQCEEGDFEDLISLLPV